MCQISDKAAQSYVHHDAIVSFVALAGYTTDFDLMIALLDKSEEGCGAHEIDFLRAAKTFLRKCEALAP